MSSFTIDPNALSPTALVGRALDVPSWFATLIQAINSHANSIDNINALPGQLINAQDPTYGALGNGSHDDTAALNAAYVAASAAKNDIYLPNGTYLLTIQGTSQRCLSPQSGVRLVGQSKAGVILKLKDGETTRTGGSGRIINAQGQTNLAFINLTIDGNTANNPDASLHSDGIFLTSNGGIGCSFVYISNVEIKNCTGAGIVPHQNCTDVLIDNVYLHGNANHGWVLGDAGGQQRIALRHVYSTGNASGFHIEVSTACDQILFDDCVGDATQGNCPYQIVGGTNLLVTNAWARNCKFTGPIIVQNADHCGLESCSIMNADAGAQLLPALKLIGGVTNFRASKCAITQQAAGNAAQAVWIAGNANLNTANNELLDCDISAQGANQDGVTLQSLTSARVRGGTIVGNVNAGTGSGINLNAKTQSTDRVSIEGVEIQDFAIGILEQSTGALHHNDVRIQGVRFKSVNLAMTACMSLDSDGNGQTAGKGLLAAEVFGCSPVSAIPMFATLPAAGRVIVGGNRNDIADYIGTGAPTFAAAKGSTYRRIDGGAGTCLYVNESGSTTWQAK